MAASATEVTYQQVSLSLLLPIIFSTFLPSSVLNFSLSLVLPIIFCPAAVGEQPDLAEHLSRADAAVCHQQDREQVFKIVILIGPMCMCMGSDLWVLVSLKVTE